MTPQQFKDKTRNLARKNNIDPQIVQRYFMMEKLLEKISESEYKNDFVLKGGFLIGSRYGLDKRSTVDIDATFRNSKLTEEKLTDIFGQLTSTQTKEGIEFELIQLTETREADCYPGYQAKFIAQLDKARVPFKLDITSGDSIYPSSTEHHHKLMFEDKIIGIPSYPTEQILAEKMHATLTFGQYNSRMKDYYDLYMIPRLETINIGALYTSVVGTFKLRNSRQSFRELYMQQKSILKDSELLKKQWINYQRQNYYAQDITYEQTVQSIDKLALSIIEKEQKRENRIVDCVEEYREI